MPADRNLLDSSYSAAVPTTNTQTRPPQRRTQVERTRETRAKLMAAAIRSIARAGYAGATLNQIARDANLTKGAIQHHFADKRELDVAVFVHGFTELEERLGKITAEGDLPTRMSSVVDAMYQAFASEAVQAAFEIDRSWRLDPPLAPFDSSDALDEQWRTLFADAPVSDHRLLQCRRLVRTAVQGHVVRQAGGIPDDAPMELATLKAAAVLLLTVEEGEQRPSRRRSARFRSA
jgi:AcrR family transcriptional regulator